MANAFQAQKVYIRSCRNRKMHPKTQPLRLVDLCMTPCGGTYVYPRLPGSWTRLDSKQELGVPNDFLANIQLETDQIILAANGILPPKDNNSEIHHIDMRE